MSQCPHACLLSHITYDFDEGLGDREFEACWHWRRSAAGGDHVHVIECVNPLPPEAMFIARILKRDDPYRLAMDYIRWRATGDSSYAIGALWDSKNGRLAGPWKS